MIFSDHFVFKTLDIKNPPLSFNADRIHTDSRSIQPNDLFVAIRGERFDGHDFVEEALSRGACAALVDSRFIKSATTKFSSPLIETSDTLNAIRRIAKAHRDRLNSKIFVVGGSNGKTTTKEYLSFLLERRFSSEVVFKTKKSENSILGVALSLLAIRKERFAVIEVGIDERGWMKQHLDIIRPDAGLITCIQEEHLERLENIETIAEEELQLLNHLRETGGRFAANVDSDWIREASPPAQTLTYGLKQRADIEGFYIKPNSLSCFGLNWKNPLPGQHNALNLLAALAGLVLMDPDIDTNELKRISESLEAFEGEAHRSRWLSLQNDIFVFDDCYNANPSSMESAIATFQDLAEGLRPIMILGDMLDLGEASVGFHQRILNVAETSSAHEILTLGPLFRDASQKISKGRATSFLNIEDLRAHLIKIQKPQTAFLLKGSRGMRLETLLSIWDDSSR